MNKNKIKKKEKIKNKTAKLPFVSVATYKPISCGYI